jgi:hypothetical protein
MKKQLFLMQRYGEKQPIPKKQLDSYLTCYDSPLNSRQSRGLKLFRVVKTYFCYFIWEIGINLLSLQRERTWFPSLIVKM